MNHACNTGQPRRSTGVLRSTILAAVLILIGSTLGAVPAHAGTADKYCVAVPAKTVTGAIDMTCDSAPDSPRLAAATAGSWLLMTWYDNWHYNEDNGWIGWYGNAGTCDYSGYSVDFDYSFQSWKNRISSFKVHGDCWTGVIYQSVEALPTGPWFSGNVESVGDYFGWQYNDRIEGFHVQRDW